MTTNDVRVRYAPSPTGHLHIGNARTALFNYLYARSLGGAFIIRIEDTDLKRNIAGGEESQLTYLKWLGIDWDESVDIGGGYGPYRQTERLDLYRAHWQELLDKGLAYRCYCTEEELERDREEQSARGEMPRYSGRCRHLTNEQHQAFTAEGRVPSVRFRVPEGKTYTFDDMVKGTISFESDGIGDFVIVKKDGIPTYNYAVALDDHLMKISHVLRGEDHISNTPRQLMVYEAHGWEPPVFAHMTLIVNESRKKLSKRDESIIQFIEQYDALGYLPEAMFNFIALLGWSPEGEQEMFTREELIGVFNAARLSKSPAVFDAQKLAWMNNEYIKKANVQRVVGLCLPHLRKARRVADELDEAGHAWVTELVSLYQDKLRFAADILPLTELFFRDAVEDEEEAAAVLAEEQVPTVLRAFLTAVSGCPDDAFTEEAVKAIVKGVQQETGFKGKQLFMPIRAAVTGQTHGPDLNRTIALLGKDKVARTVEGRL
ncbi:glutamyl-tRNA synthetase [Paenibacillus darwinianus]|uniref:Glutamate--tRNA ligase n=1 Tax=Paenibacillus darwinianus TaxID=1380763 RepID=A0A9W5S176_9BACL|nr:glutamate--tRNA ligase [Paenibacillus darwinianus]EXX84837.1 glutamyl-tRNA synthetase [Paenibacillus darwinianus]EXX89584.1 glutamyl-tRNA synthetase [Paenibacillus darwinianus]EXX90321.1 glutamyl-tRNA synthetase [Paenibacillus darwinianus]